MNQGLGLCDGRGSYVAPSRPPEYLALGLSVVSQAVFISGPVIKAAILSRAVIWPRRRALNSSSILVWLEAPCISAWTPPPLRLSSLVL